MYDLDMAEETEDIDLYVALATRTGGPILELAVGSGRVAVALALAGHDVVGVDVDPDMLARARSAWRGARGRRPAGALRLVREDMRSVRLDARFRLVVLALNSLLLVQDRGGQAAAIETMAAHLAPGGLAVIDVAILGRDEMAAYDGRLTLEWLRRDPETGRSVTKSTSARLDVATGSVDLIQLFDSWPAAGGPVERYARRDRLLLVGADELLRLVHDAGLEPEVVGGDLSLEALGPGSGRIVVVARSV